MDRDTVAPFSVLRGFSLGACLLSTMALGLVDHAHALGLGRPQTHSALGHPLRLSFPVSLRPGESLAMDCVHVDLMAGGAKLPASVISVQLEGDSDKNVRAIHVLSSVPIEEPILHAALSLGCPVQLTRQITALLDPPGSHDAGSQQAPQLQASSRVLSPALRAALATVDAKPEALLAAGLSDKVGQERLTAAKHPKATSANADGKQGIKASGSKGSSGNVEPRQKSIKATPTTSTTTTPSAAAPASVSKEESGPQLRLEAFDPGLASGSQSAAASAAEAAMTRLRTVETGLQSLQAEYRSNAKSLSVLREAQSTAPADDGGSTAMPWALAALALVLGGGLGFALGGRSTKQAGRDANWWSRDSETLAASESSEIEIASPALADEPSGVGEKARFVDGSMESGRKLVRNAEPEEPTISFAHNGDAEVQPIASGVTPEPVSEELSGVARISQLLAGDLSLEPVSVQFIEHTESKFGSLDAGAEGHASSPGAQGVSVEDLIDLEQQVDFFLVLGQDEAAVDLLQAQLKMGATSGGVSALPYLKLMDICQQRGDALAFAEIASQYAVQFKVQPPAWELSLELGRGLESYEDVILTLQSRWSDSGASMVSLQKLLSCSEERLPRFDLPALLDLLLLYSVARDRSEHEVRGEEIDLFLPLDATDSAAKPTGFDLMATMVWQGPATIPASVGVDILLDEPATGGLPTSAKTS